MFRRGSMDSVSIVKKYKIARLVLLTFLVWRLTMKSKGQIGAKYLQNTRKTLVRPEVVVLCHYKTESVLIRLKSGAVKRAK